MESRPAGSANEPGAAAGLDRLFAYGTLMAGYSRRPLLGPARLLGVGRVRGSLYDFGGYPGAVLDDGGWVLGELYHVPDLASRLATLDRAEWYDLANEARSLYVRRAVTVALPGGVSREAWVYVYNGPPGRGPRIPTGDWRARETARVERRPRGGGFRWPRRTRRI